MRWASSLLACASIGLIGCLDPCGANEVRVKKAAGGSVCVPTSQGGATTSPEADGEIGPGPYESVKLPSSMPDASIPPPPAGCRREDAGDLTVHIVAKSGEAPVIAPAAPPDARYVLVQATWFSGDDGAPAIRALRAELVVQGAVYVLGVRAASGATVDINESVTLTIAADTATHVCSLDAKSVVSSLLPPLGATTPATAAWDPTASTLTIVLSTPTGAEVELVFVPV